MSADACVVALNARAVGAKAAGRIEDAVALYREALALAPDQAALWSNLGNALNALGRASIARTGEARLRLNPALAQAEITRLEEAVACHRRAVALKPDNAVLGQNLSLALNTLGIGYRAAGRLTRSVLAHRESLSLDPEHAWGWTHLGNALREADQFAVALTAHRRAIALDPGVPAFTYNLGLTLEAAGRSDEAIACFDAVLAANPDDANTRWDRALSLLRVGRLAEGWRDYEARFAAGKLPHRDAPGARWTGQSYQGKRLLLLSEQGFGDAIWTARYLPSVKALGGTLILEARPELVRLMEHMGCADQVIPKGAKLPDADYHGYICSLPGLFTPTRADISGEPYLTTPPGAGRAAVAAIAAVRGKTRIGIVWSGSTTFRDNHRRRLPLDAFLTGFALPEVQLFSLQKGPPADELRPFPHAPVIDLAPMLADFADTAAAVSALDRIVMTDSAVAHLAGALGKDTLLLLREPRHWMWNAFGVCPWYRAIIQQQEQNGMASGSSRRGFEPLLPP